MAHNHNHHSRKSRRSSADSLFAFANLFNVLAGIFAGYAGAQNRAEVDRMKAENLLLKNQIAALKIGQESNKIVIGDLTIDEKTLKNEKLRRELGLSGGDFKATGYPEPGNIREEERRHG